MKPARFAYRAPATIEETLTTLAEAPDDTNLLAGGQSLVPLLNMRLARPAVVLDLGHVEGLGAIEPFDGGLRLGAMVRQRTLELDALVHERVPLLPAAVGYIAHLPIRTRGTVGGSLAHADPAAELPPAMLVLDARLVIQGATARSVSAGDFFVGPYSTAVEPGELLTAVEIPPLAQDTGWSFLEVARVHGAFAIVAVAALLHLGADGRIDLVRLALSGVGPTPHMPSWLAEMATEERPSQELFARIGERVRDEVRPSGDGHAGSEYRRVLAGVLAARALVDAAQRAARSRDDAS